MSIPYVVKSDFPLSAAQAAHIQEKIKEASKECRPLILGHGLSIVRIENSSPFDPAIVRCGYCGQWAAIQTECRHCGASIF